MARAKKDGKRPAPATIPSEAATDRASTDESSAAVGPLVVALGASAGGLNALTRFFETVPGDSGMAFVIIQHLDPRHPSLIAELVGRHTEMPVVQVEGAPEVLANRVYVIPSNRELRIEGGRLLTCEVDARRRLTTTIDLFMRSLATECRERAAGVVLSGTGSDGSLGLREIKAHGGMTMVQDPSTAEHDGMPRAAIATGSVDHVATVEEMPDLLTGYARHPYVDGETEGASETELVSSDLIGEILAVLKARAKHDFTSYRRNLLIRRIQRRMGLNRIEDFNEYLEFLRSDSEEPERLFKDLLIGVTGFFREPEAYKTLSKEIIPTIVDARQVDTPIRVWVPGCSSGEEAYSIVIALMERLRNQSKPNLVQVFASDIDDEALARGRAGVYPETIEADVPRELLDRYFLVEGEHYRVRREVRDAVVFAKHNLVSDPPFSKLDLISCRNLLIYLQPDLQGKLLTLFHFALAEGGFLFLGGSEAVSAAQGLFEPISKKWRLFRRTNVIPASATDFIRVSPRSYERTSEDKAAGDLGASRDFGRIANQHLLDNDTPAAVLIDRTSQILFFHGDTGRFLGNPVGRPTSDLPSLARDALGSRLRAAIRRAIQEDDRIEVAGARLKIDGGYVPVRMSVRPVARTRHAEGLLVVTFEEGDGFRDSDDEKVIDGGELLPGGLEQELERELQATREELQSTIEELESSNEELKASNEEVISMNEELQSTNEELEASKEELQSLNEELTTINSQLLNNVEELESANNDLANLLASSQVPTLFLDEELRIKRFTDSVRGLFNVIPADVGRPIADLTPWYSDPRLGEDAREVLRNLTPVSREIVAHDKRWHLCRVTPYRTQDDRIEGVVVTFTDITDIKRSQNELRQAKEHLETAVERRTAFIDLLRRAATEANRAVSLVGALGEIVPDLCDHIAADYAQVWLKKDDDHRVLVPIGPACVADGRSLDAVVRATSESKPVPGSGPVWEAMERGEVVWSTDLETAIGRDRAASALAAGLRVMMIVPIRVGDGCEGFLEVLFEAVDEEHGVLSEMALGVCTAIGHVVERIGMQKKMSDLTDEEQRRLGQELHDTVAQEIAGIRLLAEGLRRRFDADSPEAATVGDLADAAGKAQGHVRSLARGLVPAVISAGGLRSAIENLIDRLQKDRGVSCEFQNPDEVVIEDGHIATNLYYIAQEAAKNAVEHGRAERIRIVLENLGRDLVLRIIDDGCGFQPGETERRAGSGLRIMSYRARQMGASFDCASQPGRGTRVTVVLDAARPT